MPGSLTSFIEEANRLTAAEFRQRYPFPFLVPIGFAQADAAGGQSAGQTVVLRAREHASPLWGPHPLAGTVLSLTAAGGASRPIRVGRASDNDLVLPDEAISAHHCGFEASEVGVTLTDLGSTNGTMVNGARLAPLVATPIEDEDVVTFGRYRFQLLDSLTFWTSLRGLTGEASHET